MSTVTAEELEEMQRKLAFAEACGDPLDFDGIMSRISGLLFKWGQADTVSLILPPESPDQEPVLYLCGRHAVLAQAEESIRAECAGLLGAMDFADVSAEALRLHRGPELTPLHDPLRDGPMYNFWSQALEVDGQTVGILALFGFTDWVLAPRLRRLLGGVAPIIARGVRNAASVEHLRACAIFDDLTGLLNRRGFNDAMGREIARAERCRRDLSVLLLDLDEFKQVNDVHGHAEGDRVLGELGALMREELRTTDAVARLGGDEFVIVLPEVGPQMASVVGERLRRAAAGIAYGGGKAASLSVGVASFRAGEGDDTASLMRRADDALYAAKRRGRGRVVNLS